MAFVTHAESLAFWGGEFQNRVVRDTCYEKKSSPLRITLPLITYHARWPFRALNRFRPGARHGAATYARCRHAFVTPRTDPKTPPIAMRTSVCSYPMAGPNIRSSNRFTKSVVFSGRK